jgi:hypothetical protein
MNRHSTCLLAATLLLAISGGAAELKDCIKLQPKGGDATFTNVCTNTINIMYCVDNAASARSCAQKTGRVVTLGPNAVEVIPDFGGAGKGEIHSALCAYPEAPEGWKPGPNNAYTCKKTCVMC